MRLWRNIDEAAEALTACAVTIGNFDGMHRGHQEIVRALKEIASVERLDAVAMTFDPHPAAVLGAQAPPKLMTVEERVSALCASGVENVLVLPFTREFSEISAERFVLELLIQKLKLRSLCIGSTTHVGRGREGTPKRLSEFAADFGFSMRVVEDVRVGAEIVSSSKIRGLLQHGNVRGAAEMLGRRFSTAGVVEAGDGRGRTIGFPTANLGRIQTMLPAAGVYAVDVEVGGVLHPGVTNIGFRPTFRLHSLMTVETYLLDFSGDLVGEGMRLHWIERIRGEKRFASAEELKAQIRKDVTAARLSIAEPRRRN